MITRTIGKVEIDVDEQSASNVYLPRSVANRLSGTRIIDVVHALFLEDKHPRPYTVNWELTDRCNYGCPFCYIHTTESAKSELLAWSELKAVSQELIDRGMIVCTLSGGEPTLHPSFTKLYRYLKEKGVLVRVFSNGSMITPDILETFKELPPYKIEISLYGISENAYRHVTEQSSVGPDDVLQSILALKENGIKVVAKMPLNRMTIDEYEEVRVWCSCNHVPFYSSFELQDAYNGASRQGFCLDESTIRLLMKDKVESFPFEKRRKSMFSCDAGKTGVMISSSLEVRPCMESFKVPELCFNSRKLGFAKALDSLFATVEKLSGPYLQHCPGCEASGYCRVCSIHELLYRSNASMSYSKLCRKTRSFHEWMISQS